jgi:gliding motility associated protien GldN
MKPLFCLLMQMLITANILRAQCLPQSQVGFPAPDPCNDNRIDKPFPVSLPYLRQADVMWSQRTWRVIDLREKMNLPIYYPTEPQFCLRSLFDVLKCGILESNLTAFANPLFDDEFTTPMTKAEVSALLISWDSLHQVEDVNNPGTFISAPMKTEITSDHIRQYWIKEDWFFDKERSVMECRIIGICPVASKLSESGEMIGLKPLFWVYFPEARPFLARAAVYNSHNDSGRMSYDELFMKRRFASYVYKESNVYNRNVSEYATGLGALLESERIKEDIFKYEDNLWHR